MLERKPFIWYFPGEGTTLNDSCSTVFAVDAVCPSETPLYFEYSGSSDFRAAGNVDSVDKTATVKVPPLTLPGVTNQYQCAFYREAGGSGAVSGVNENGVAVALKFASTRKLRIAPQGQLSGEDLVLTALRYGKTALHAAQLLIQIIEQQGVKSAETGAVFDWTPGLVFADARGAWLLETACGFWALGKVPKVESVFTNNLYIEEPLSHSEDLKSLASLEDCSSPRAAGRISFRQLFAPSEPRESFLQESEPHQTSEKNDSLGKPVDIATIIGRVRQQRPAQACLTDSNPQRNTIRSGAFISILTPDITRRIHLFACEEDTACAMFKPFFLEREGGADLGAAHAAYVSPQGLLHQRRRYALQRRRLDLENSAIPVLQYRSAEEQRLAYQPSELCERLRFLEMICIEKALTACGYSSSYRQREHLGLCREFEQKLTQLQKSCVKLDTKMLFPAEVPQTEWPKLFQRYAKDSKETLFEKSLMREEYEYELFMLDGGDPTAKSRRIRGLQLAPYPGEHFCIPIESQVLEKPDGSMPHLFVYQSE